MPETCRCCGADTDGKSRLRLTCETWQRINTGDMGYIEVTVGVFCDRACLGKHLDAEKGATS